MITNATRGYRPPHTRPRLFLPYYEECKVVLLVETTIRKQHITPIFLFCCKSNSPLPDSSEREVRRGGRGHEQLQLPPHVRDPGHALHGQHHQHTHSPVMMLTKRLCLRSSNYKAVQVREAGGSGGRGGAEAPPEVSWSFISSFSCNLKCVRKAQYDRFS